jgi:hypothetical protein
MTGFTYGGAVGGAHGAHGAQGTVPTHPDSSTQPMPHEMPGMTHEKMPAPKPAPTKAPRTAPKSPAKPAEPHTGHKMPNMPM